MESEIHFALLTRVAPCAFVETSYKHQQLELTLKPAPTSLLENLTTSVIGFYNRIVHMLIAFNPLTSFPTQTGVDFQ
jgi:hypothetical protein